MALRVLLADESSTIKKAIQMVLSTYGVEIKTVPTGIDVLSVTQSFNPDIIMADILLNKKNGYEVCLEIKNTASTKNIPVILMWSSFMQIDEQLYKNSKADAALEKPFETESLKSLIEKLVPKMQTFPLKGLLNHPALPDFEDSDTFIKQKHDFNALSKAQLKPEPKSYDTKSFEKSKLSTTNLPPDTPKEKITEKQEDIDEDIFSISGQPPKKQSEMLTELQSENSLQSETSSEILSENDEWSSARANQFIIETENFGEFEEVKIINTKNDGIPSLQNRINEQIQSYLKDTPVTAHKAKSKLGQKSSYSNFDDQLIKEEIKQTAERICWQIIPEITEKVVREELAKLLQGIEKSI